MRRRDHERIVARYEAEIARKDERIAELEDRLTARSLAELRAFRPVAIRAPEPDPHEGMDYLTDPTGIIGEWVPREER